MSTIDCSLRILMKMVFANYCLQFSYHRSYEVTTFALCVGRCDDSILADFIPPERGTLQDVWSDSYIQTSSVGQEAVNNRSFTVFAVRVELGGIDLRSIVKEVVCA